MQTESKCTVVSTLPWEIISNKPGLVPSTFVIPAAKKDGFSILTVGDSYYIKLIPFEEEPMRVREESEKVSKAIVKDYITACMGTSTVTQPNGAIPMPGLFWVPGEHTRLSLKTDHKTLLTSAGNNTMAWFQALVAQADDNWAKNNQRKFISDVQRIACNHLALRREWDYDAILSTSAICPACMTGVNPGAAVCLNCHAILDEEKYNKLKFAKG